MCKKARARKCECIRDLALSPGFNQTKEYNRCIRKNGELGELNGNRNISISIVSCCMGRST